jgi:hypothetical protein
MDVTQFGYDVMKHIKYSVLWWDLYDDGDWYLASWKWKRPSCPTKGRSCTIAAYEIERAVGNN